MKTYLKIIIALIAAIVAFSGFFILNRPESAKTLQSTDDAYVRADLTVVAPHVAGLISEVLVADNQHVAADELLLRIDERELQIRLANVGAEINSLEAQLTRQQSVITQARAAVDASAASLKLAENDRQRFAILARSGSGSVQAAQQAEKEWATQTAALARDRAGLRSAELQVAVLQAELDKARAEQDDAELKLSYAAVRAPVAGVVSQRRARAGAYTSVGEALLTIVPLEEIYVEANFRETQLANVRVGQAVDVSVDALPGVRLQGRVESLGAASGASFSLLPPHNASGNFTKITQRLPVRIELDKHQPEAARLRVGMSVRPSIDTGSDGAGRD